MPVNADKWKIRLTNPRPIFNILTVRTKIFTSIFTLILIAAFLFASGSIAFTSVGAQEQDGHVLTKLNVCGIADGAISSGGSAAPFVCEAHFSMGVPVRFFSALNDVRLHIPIVTPDVSQRPPQV
jgi:hypothetical protein